MSLLCEGKRLLMYCPALEGGGAERVMVTLANSFARHGVQVILVTARAAAEVYRAELSPAVEYHVSAYTGVRCARCCR
jgi:hypothetical protein